MPIPDDCSLPIQLNSQAFLEGILNNIADPIFVKNRQHRLVFVNNAFCTLIGSDRAELIGKSDADFYPQADLKLLWEKDEGVFTLGTPYAYDMPFTNHQGQNCIISIKTSLLHGADNSPFLVGTIDQSASGEQAARVQQAEATNRALLEAMPDLLFRVQKDGLLLNLATVGSFKPTDVGNVTVGVNIFDLLPPPLAQRRRRYTHLAIETGVLQVYEQEIMVEGQLRYEEVRIVPINDNEVLTMVRDISARKRAEVALQQLNEQLEKNVEERTRRLTQVIAQLEREISERKRVEAQLKERDRLLAGVAKATNCLLTISDDQQSIDQALAILGTAANVDRIYIVAAQPSPSERSKRQRWEWIAADVLPAIDPSQRQTLFHNPTLLDWYKKLSGGLSIGGIVQQFPPPIRALFKPQGIRSLLLMPIELNGTFWGFIGFDNCHTERVWSETEKTILQTAVGSIGESIARHQAEANLRQSEATNRALITAIPDLLIRVRRDGTYLDIIRTDSYLLYDNGNFIIGNSVYDSLPPDLAERRMHYVREALNTGKVQLYEQHLTIDGVLKIEEVRVVVIRDDEVLIIVRDISDRKRSEAERKHTEAAIQESEARFRQLAENIDGYFWLLAVEGQYLYVSPGYEKIWGYPIEYLYQNPEDWLAALHPDDRDFVIAADAQQWGGGYDLEYRMIRPDGEIRWIRDRAFPVRDAQGNIYRMAGIADDITARKQAEEALRQSEARLRQQSQDLENALRELQQTQAQMIQSEKMSSLGQLVAGIAHEINNPVNFIYGNIEPANGYITDALNLIALYQDHYPNPPTAIQEAIEAIELDFLVADLPKVLSSMQMGADRIRQIVLSLRTFSRLDEAEFKQADIHAGIDSTLVILESRLKAQPNHPSIQVIKNYGRLPLVECYAGQLNQVFMNILTNAIDALEERDQQRLFEEIEQFPSCIKITTAVVHGDRVVIKIADNGSGMSKEIKQRIFDPFFTTKPVGKGTGMGMSISYQIIKEKHGGSLQCLSSPGQGTEFIVEIPANIDQAT